jgi:hypothetical protein
LSILVNDKDVILSQGTGFLSIMFIDMKLIAVVSVESIFGAEPHESQAVLKDTSDSATRESLPDRKSAEVDIAMLGEKVARQDEANQEQRT